MLRDQRNEGRWACHLMKPFLWKDSTPLVHLNCRQIVETVTIPIRIPPSRPHPGLDKSRSEMEVMIEEGL